MTIDTINLIIIIWAWILILLTAFFKRDKNLVTVIGILGTFIWIILGLYAFNTADIEWSITGLLSGLKTAFVTSIFWLVAALVLGLLEKKDESKDESDYLIEIRDEIKKLQHNSTPDSVGTNDEAILKELQLLNKNNSTLSESFENFSNKMAENNSKVLIDAMHNVMEDFNSKINDQLWQSFSQLSTSVDSLVKWQENYQQTVESTTEAFHASKKSLEESAKSLETSSKASKIFSEVSTHLEWQLITLNNSLELFKSGTREFEWVAISVDKMSKWMIASVDSLSQNFVWKAERMVWESEKQITIMSNTFSSQSNDLTEAHQLILSKMRKEIDANNKNMSDQFLRIWVRLEQQVNNLDEQLWRELEKSLNSLGQQLTALSERFVLDYGNLADKLEKLSKNK